jgi:hypothetical protein
MLEDHAAKLSLLAKDFQVSISQWRVDEGDEADARY